MLFKRIKLENITLLRRGLILTAVFDSIFSFEFFFEFFSNAITVQLSKQNAKLFSSL